MQAGTNLPALQRNLLPPPSK